MAGVMGWGGVAKSWSRDKGHSSEGADDSRMGDNREDVAGKDQTHEDPEHSKLEFILYVGHGEPAKAPEERAGVTQLTLGGRTRK